MMDPRAAEALRHELVAWVRAARGALRWHLESGESALAVPEDFEWSGAAPPQRAVPVGATEPASARPTPTAPPKRNPDAAPAPAAPAQRALEPEAQRAALERLHARLEGCTRCGLSASRERLVHGQGPMSPRLAFVSDYPLLPDSESGALLTRMMGAMGLSVEQVWMTSLLRCRPGPNRPPTPQEVATCAPFLHDELSTVSPEVIVSLGLLPSRALLATEAGIRNLRGQWHAVPGLPGVALMSTFDPETLLQHADLKRGAWDDLKKVMTRLGLTPPR
jgi:DNA polymerase